MRLARRIKKNLCIDFYQKVLDRQFKSSFATLEDGHRIMQLVESVLKSHREKKVGKRSENELTAN